MTATSPAKPDPVVLEPQLDPVTGDIVYSELRSHDGVIVQTGRDAEIRQVPPKVISRLPKERMAGTTSWEVIQSTLRADEEGVNTGADVVVIPGGELALTQAGTTSTVSRLPQSRMAAATPGPRSSDVNELRQLDPKNVESWTPVKTGLVSGWTFRLRPPVSRQRDFVFFTFRSPSDGNAFRISPLYPNKDGEYGHSPHMIETTVGGQSIPIICGPDGAPAVTLAEVRTHAAKWMMYTSLRMAGVKPGFSE
jgi:hypothetical protein